MKNKLLLSGLGGSLFPYLHHQLIKHYDLYYADSDTSLKYIYPDLKIFEAPLAKSIEYREFILDLILSNKIDTYIPLIDEEILTALNLAEEIEELSVLAPKHSFSKLCLNKYELMKVFKKLGISDINTITGNESINLLNPPYFIKPVIGRGSRGTQLLETEEQLQYYLKFKKEKLDELLIQECCKGTEYTVGAVVNKKNEILSIGTRRIIVKRGITISAVTENNEQINEKIIEIVHKLEPCGPFNVQLFIDHEGQIKIFEINPRFSTTSIMSYEAGVNEIQLLIENLDVSNFGDIILPDAGVFLKRTWFNHFYK